MSRHRSGRFEVEWIVVSYRTLLFIVVPATVVGTLVVGLSMWNRHEAKQAKRDIEATLSDLEARLVPLRLDSTMARRATRVASEIAHARELLSVGDLPRARDGAATARGIFDGVVDGADDEEHAQLVAVEGSVQVKAWGSQSWVEAQPGMSLNAGDLVMTAKGAAARYRGLDGSTTDVQGDTMLRIARSRRDQASGDTDVSIVVSSGRLTVETTESWSPGSTSVVETANLSANVEANSLVGVGFDETSGRSTVDVVAGAASVTAGGTTIGLEGRDQLGVSVDGIERRRLPAVPRLLTPPRYQLLVVGDLGGKLELEWESSRDAREYRVALASSLLFTRLIREWRVRTAYVVVDALPVGSYYWRVSAIDGSGIESGPSPAGIFRIADSLPEGTPPPLSVETFDVLGEGLYLIEGTAKPEVALTVDDGFRVAELRAGGSGKFRHLLAIPEDGRYVVTVTARTAEGLETKVSRRVEVRLP